MAPSINILQKNYKSKSKKAVIFEGDNSYTFEIIDTENLVQYPKWTLLSKNKKDEMHIVKKDTVVISIPNKLCGVYNYYLKKSYLCAKTQKEVENMISISGECERKIVEASASKLVLAPGNALNIKLSLEGLNDNKLILEIYSSDGKKTMDAKGQCVEGEISFFIGGDKTKRWKPNSTYSVKVKDKDKKSYLNYGGEEHIFELSTTANDNSPIENKLADNKTFSAVQDSNRTTNKEILSVNEIPEMEVCQQIRCSATYTNTDSIDPQPDIRWEVIIGDKEDTENNADNRDENGEIKLIEGRKIKLEDVKLEGVCLKDIILKAKLMKLVDEEPIDIQLTGTEIRFPVPKEWGQRKVQLVAYLKYEIIAPSNAVIVKDHIVAAFYRINTKESQPFEVADVQEVRPRNNGLGTILEIFTSLTAPVSYPLLAVLSGSTKLPPFCHIQGVFREDKKLYITGSTPNGTPPYVYTANLDNEKEENWAYEKTVIIDGSIRNLFEHPGGLQVAGNLLAIGLEDYHCLGSHTVDRGITSILNLNKDGYLSSELEDYNLRVVRYDDHNKELMKKVYNDITNIQKGDPVYVYLDSKNKIKRIVIKEKEVYNSLLSINEDDLISLDLIRSKNVGDLRLFDNDENRIDSTYKAEKSDTSKEGEKKLKELEKKKPLNDRASCAGIVSYEKGKYLVAVRGNNNGIYFYSFEKTAAAAKKEEEKNGKILEIGEEPFANMGDFQNVNLFMYNKDIYMFGMGDEKIVKTTYLLQKQEYLPKTLNEVDQADFRRNCEYITKDNAPGLFDKMEVENERIKMKENRYYTIPIDNHKYIAQIQFSSKSTKNTCRLYKLKLNNDMVTIINAVKINKFGNIVENENYREVDDNKLVFKCKGGNSPCFHWASCVYISPTKKQSEKQQSEEESEEKQNLPFDSEIMVYTTGALVNKKEATISGLIFK